MSISPLIHRRKLFADLLKKVNERTLLQNFGNSLDSPNLSLSLPLLIDFPPVDRNTYPLVTIWTTKEWDDHPKNKANKNTDAGISQPAQKSPKKAKPGEDAIPVDSLYYIQDTQGNSIDKSRATLLGDHARRIWTQLRMKGMEPESYLKMSTPALQYYRQMMYGDFPELRLCEGGHWKLERYSKDNYPNWYRRFKAPKNEIYSKQVKLEGNKNGESNLNVNVKIPNEGKGGGKIRRELSPPSEVRPTKRARSETQPNTPTACMFTMF